MPAKLTSMLLKFLQNQEQMGLNIGKKLKTASLNSRFTGSKRKCTSTWSLLKNFETLRPKVAVNVWVYPPTTSRALYFIWKIIVWKKLFLFYIDPKCN